MFRATQTHTYETLQEYLLYVTDVIHQLQCVIIRVDLIVVQLELSHIISSGGLFLYLYFIYQTLNKLHYK